MGGQGRKSAAERPPRRRLETLAWEAVEPSAVVRPHDVSGADAFMRRLLRVPPDATPGDTAQSVFGASVLLSAIRCSLTYVVLPVLKPVVDLSGGVGPVLGLLLGAVSAVAIVFSMRRFVAARHRWRWGYIAVGSGILVLLAVQAVGDIGALG